MPQRLGKYRIDGVLGSGATGVVYKSYDVELRRVVALKTVRAAPPGAGPGPGLAADPTLYARLRNEASACARLAHPGIVAVYDCGEIDGRAYLAMEYVAGAALSARLAPGVPVRIEAALHCVAQLLRALAYAHVRGVIHRDVKPANLLITPQARLKITDFGIAAPASGRDGAVTGTPSYMSPEQFRGEAVDGRSDVFAAGVLLYQLLTGERPFSGSAASVMQQILNETPPHPSAKNPALGTAYDAVVQQALAKQPAQRHAGALAFLAALRAARRASRDGARSRAGAAQARRIALAFARQPPAAPAAPAAPAGYGWKQALLPALETLLALQLGPMAQLLLRNAAADVDGVEELCARLLPHIPSEQGRRMFMDGVGALRAGSAPVG